MQRKYLDRLKRHLEGYKAYVVARKVKWCLESSLKDVDGLKRRVASLKPEGPSQGNVLISRVNDAFFLLPGEPIPISHTNYWEALQMARTFLNFGYCVDVIYYLNDEFIPRENYSFFIDVRRNMERLGPLLSKTCVKILHADTAHILFHNAAEAGRLLALQQRRGVTLQPRRFEMPNLAIEHADCATVLGNDFTLGTYSYAKKPMYRVPVPAAVLYPFPEGKDFEACRKRFLWLGSGGMVHKGVDLLLEAFAEMPEYHLTLCGPVQQEKDFEMAYYRELYQTPNIHTVGWVDLDSPEFVRITNSCVGLIYPSCSEGQAGSVVTCLHAALIPIISYESGVDVHDFGFLLKTCSISEIKDSIRMVTDLPLQELKVRARKAWEFARENHTRERYAQEYRKVVSEIIAAYR